MLKHIESNKHSYLYTRGLCWLLVAACWVDKSVDWQQDVANKQLLKRREFNNYVVTKNTHNRNTSIISMKHRVWLLGSQLMKRHSDADDARSYD